MCLAGRIYCLFLCYFHSPFFFIRLCDVAHVYFSSVLFTLSTIMSASFSSLLCIPCILLPACLCYVPLFLCNYNFLPDHSFLCICRSYTGVCPHWDRLFLCCSHLSFVFPAFFLAFFNTAPFSSDCCRLALPEGIYIDWLFVIQCQLVLFFIFFFYLPEPLYVPQYSLLIPPFFYLLCCLHHAWKDHRMHECC